MAEPLLRIRDLSVSYGQVRAITGVSLHVDAGEAVALVGANGAGKSTLFKAAVGLLRVAGGSMALAGRTLDGLSPERRARHGLGYAPEGRRVFPGLTVRENLEVAVFGGRAERQRLVDYAFEVFPALAEHQGASGWQLSGGQQQMLAIARALMGRPKLLLMDEPSLGLSPKLADDVLRRVRTVVADGISVLLAEQNASKALRYCERAYVLEVGRVVLSGPSATLRDDPAVQLAYLGGD